MNRYGNISITENGAVGFRTTFHPLLDLNFKASSLRNRHGAVIANEFAKAYAESPKYAIKWLFFLRDIREGLGERRTFRICMIYLTMYYPKIASALLALIPEYGRYDDLLALLYSPLGSRVCALLKKQLWADRAAMEKGEPVSLLAKWLPSINTSSAFTRADARYLAGKWGMSEREYRKTLSALRAYLNVVEVKMSAGQWAEIDYEKVPAKANMRYNKAFLRRDAKRREAYLYEGFFGGGKLNSDGVIPYEVVRFYTRQESWCKRRTFKEDLMAEWMWKVLLEQGFRNDWGFDDCIVVADGSGSMYNYAGGSTSVTAIEICHSLAVYFAQQLSGPFHDKAITFSEHPQFIDLSAGKNLKEKLEIMFKHTEVANTDIEAVFRMLLDEAIRNEVPADRMPKQLLIISDMEFDEATYDMDLDPQQALFTEIEKSYRRAGYKMPRLIFWNVCGRTDTIPMVDNEEGLCLLSGFSQNAMKIAVGSEQKDAYASLLSVLDGPRYEPVEKALAGIL